MKRPALEGFEIIPPVKNILKLTMSRNNFKKPQIRLFKFCKYLQWATLHVHKHDVTVNPHPIAMFVTKKIFGLCEIIVITFL